MRSRAVTLMSSTASLALAAGLLAASSANAACPDLSATTVGVLNQGALDSPVAIVVPGATTLDVAAAPPATSSIGVLACASGIGTATVTTAGQVVSHDGDGVDAYGENASITIAQTGGQVTGFAGRGLFATAQGIGDVSISTGKNAVTAGGAGQAAIGASANGGNVSLDLHGVVGAGGVTANTTGTGTIDAKVAGMVTDGVRLTTVDGNESLLVHGAGTAIDGGAAGGNGIEVDTWDGAASVTSQSGTTISSSGSSGVSVQSVAGSVSIDLHGQVTTAPIFGGNGVVAMVGAGAGSETIRVGDITAGNTAVAASNGGTGDTHIVSNGTVTAAGDGIFASNYSLGSGGLTIAVNGDITSGGSGVDAESEATAAPLAITVNNATITTASGPWAVRGWQAAPIGDAPVTVTLNDATVVNHGGDGVMALANADGAVTVALHGATINAQDTAILLTGAASGDLTATLAGGAKVVSANGYGLSTTNVDGATTIVLGKGASLQGLQGGILATTSGVGPIAISAASDSSIYSFNGTGVLASSNGGDVSVKALGSVTTDPVFGGNGVVAYTSGGSGDVDVLADGSIAATNAIFVSNGGSGTTTVTSRGSLQGMSGISATAYTFGAGAVRVYANGDIKTLGHAIDAVTVGTDSIVDVQIGKGANLSSVWGGWTVRAWAQAPIGDTSASVSVNGATVTNQAGDALLAINYANGATSVTVNGASTIFSGGAYAIETNAAGGPTAITIGKGSSVIGGAAGVYATASGGSVALANAGTIGALANDHGGAAVMVSGASSLTLSNAASGLIDGRITAGDNVAFANAGVWKSIGNSDFGTDFGAASNSVTNTGVIQAAYDAVPGFGIPVASTAFMHLGAFNNGSAASKGVVTMINGMAGDVLTVSGLFNGAAGHSVLAVDAYLGGDGSIADELHLLGGSAGKTKILINDVNSGDGAVNKAGIVLVTGVTTATDFVIDPTSPNYDAKYKGIDHGLFLYQLSTVGGVAELTSRPGVVAAHAPSMLTGLQQIWTAAGVGASGDGAGGVDHLAFAGGSAEPPRVWMTASNWTPSRLNAGRQSLWSGPGEPRTDLDGSVEVNRGYVSRDFTGTTADVTLNAGYDQTTGSLVTGVDLVRRRGQDGAFVLGVVSGYVQSDQAFLAGSDAVSYGGALVGLYSSWSHGPLRLDGNFRADLLKARYLGPRANGASEGHATVMGGELNAAYSRSVGRHWLLQPLATLSLSQASLDDLHPYGSVMRFSGGGSAKAGLGLRLVGQASTESWTIKLAGTARVWNEFLGSNTAALGQTAADVLITDRFGGVSAEFGARLDLGRKDSRLNAFIGGIYRVRSNLGAASLASGVTWRW